MDFHDIFTSVCKNYFDVTGATFAQNNLDDDIFLQRNARYEYFCFFVQAEENI